MIHFLRTTLKVIAVDSGGVQVIYRSKLIKAAWKRNQWSSVSARGCGNVGVGLGSAGNIHVIHKGGDVFGVAIEGYIIKIRPEEGIS